MTDEEIEAGESCVQTNENQGDRWTFIAILPDSSFIHTLHHGERNLEQATEFVGQIKAKSDSKAPLFASDDWFYEKALLEHYGFDYTRPYAGRGRYAHSERRPIPDLKYVQVQKKRDERGRILEINTRIVFGTIQDIERVFDNSERCKTINTVFVESRNGKFRKDDARFIRKTLCHSKKAIFHDAQANFTAQVMNYTRTNDGLKVMMNPNAPLFKRKYQHRTPAMAQKLIDKPLSVKELLMWRPQLLP